MMKHTLIALLLLLSSVPLRVFAEEATSVPGSMSAFEIASNPYFLLPGCSAGYVHTLTPGQTELLLSAGLWVQYLPAAARTEAYLETSAELRKPRGVLGVALTASPMLAAFEGGGVNDFFSCTVLGLSLRHHLPLCSSVPATAVPATGHRLELILEPGFGWVVSGQGFSWVPDIVLRLRLKYRSFLVSPTDEIER